MICEADTNSQGKRQQSEEWTYVATKFDWARMHGEKAMFTLRVAAWIV